MRFPSSRWGFSSYARHELFLLREGGVARRIPAHVPAIHASDFEPFYFDSAHAWGRVYTVADWERIVHDSAPHSGHVTRTAHVTQLLDAARVATRQDGDLPLIGTRYLHHGETMRIWAQERGMESTLLHL